MSFRIHRSNLNGLLDSLTLHDRTLVALTPLSNISVRFPFIRRTNTLKSFSHPLNLTVIYPPPRRFKSNLFSLSLLSHASLVKPNSSSVSHLYSLHSSRTR